MVLDVLSFKELQLFCMGMVAGAAFILVYWLKYELHKKKG